VYPTKEQINNRLESLNTILQALYEQHTDLQRLIQLQEEEQKALYLLLDVIKGTKK